MSGYGLLQLASSTEGRARGGLRQAAQYESHRNRTNEQIEAADDNQKTTLASTVTAAAGEKGLKNYWDVQNGAGAAEGSMATTSAGGAAPTAAELSTLAETGLVDGAANTAMVDGALVSGTTTTAGTAGTTATAAELAAASEAALISGTEAATVGLSQGALTTGATTAGTTAATTAATGAAATGAAGAGSAGTGMLAAMGPWGWAAMAGIAAIALL